MTKKNGSVKTQFAPGNPGGPGRPPLDPVLKEAKRLTKNELEVIANKYLWMPLDQLVKAKDDPKLVTIESWLCAIIYKGRMTGEWSGFEWLAQRLVGKVKDQVEVSHPTPFVIRHLSGEQTVLGAKVEKKDDD